MKNHLIAPGTKVKLNRIDAENGSFFKGDKEEAKARLDELREQLSDLQELLYAEHKWRVLIILQGMDTSGKDGVIRRIFQGVSPQGVRVVSFKKPTEIEWNHDYLWRIHRQAPSLGEIVIFNRSHYESVVAERILELVPKSTWSRRFEHINAFEKMLTDENTVVLKFFLHIDKQEQLNRFLSRRDTPRKHWKLVPSDIAARKQWDAHLHAFDEALTKTSKPNAPWVVVPANRKWYRDLVVCTHLVHSLKALKMRYPKPDFDPESLVIE